VPNAAAQTQLVRDEAEFAAKLAAKPDDDNTRFALGLTRFLRSIEARAQRFYRHGYRPGIFGNFGMTNLPVPANKEPTPLNYEEFRRIFSTWLTDLAEVDATLAAIRSPDVKITFLVHSIFLDIDESSAPGANESLLHIYNRFRNGAPGDRAVSGSRLEFHLDRGDVDWLRGYCHLLSAIAECWLAYEFHTWFDEVGYVFFTGAKRPAGLENEVPNTRPFDFPEILDAVAVLHLVRLPVAEPERLKSALGHLESMIALSRSSWKFILAETDDDAEWLPSPNQRAIGSTVQITRAMVDGWHQFLDEFEAILAGKKLAPFWRGTPSSTRGINVRRVLLEPRTLDLVLWVRGTAAAPYLETGEVTRQDTWDRFNRVFNGEFVGFAMWFN
jgi:hypothetical protein